MKIVIAHGHSSIEVFNSMVPFILASEIATDWEWKFVDHKLNNIFNQSGNILILLRRYKADLINQSEVEKELTKLKQKFDKVIYFDDSASSSVILFNIFPYIDQYWKRSCLKDIKLYSKRFYGGQLFSDFYHKRYGVVDENMTFYNQTSDPSFIKKFRVAWNIGAGAYPVLNSSICKIDYFYLKKITTAISILPQIDFIRKIIKIYIERMKGELIKNVDISSKDIKISARFISDGYRNSIGFHRKILNNSIMDNDIFLKGIIPKSEFIKESNEVCGMLSPFGWGEICFRDFEALLAGSYLIKPDVSHINTWPNIYSVYEDNFLNWDMSNIEELADILQDKINVNQAINNSRIKYLECINSLPNRAIRMLKEISNI
tara:strand:- start:507 stop:1631 length:1125 start_codon:yes stop_codon:yes gene_type:complete